MNKPKKYLPISADELQAMLAEAKRNYLLYCKMSAEYEASKTEPSKTVDKQKGASKTNASQLPEEILQYLKTSTGIFDEAMRRVARDYSEEKFDLLDHYYRYVRIEEAWGTRLWMNILYNLMGFPKTFWLMRHCKWLI